MKETIEMTTLKQEASKAIKRLPTTVSIEKIMYEVYETGLLYQGRQRLQETIFLQCFSQLSTTHRKEILQFMEQLLLKSKRTNKPKHKKLKKFHQLQKKAIPFAKKQGLFTDEDIFNC
jgi:hypothetical protein